MKLLSQSGNCAKFRYVRKYYFLSESKMVPTPTNSFSKNTSFFLTDVAFISVKSSFFVQNVSFQKMDMTKKEEFCFSLFCNFTRHLCRQLAVEILFTKFTKESFFFSEDVFLNFCRTASYNDFWESFMTWINLKIGFQVASVLWLGSSNFGVSCFFLLL